MVVAEILSDNDFQSAKFNVLHLYEPGVDECDHFNLILNTLSEKSEYKDISFAKCSTKTVPKLLSKFEVSSVPTVVFFHSGRFVDKLTGADPINLNKKLQEILKLIHGTKQPLETRLKSLINSAPVMLFMKGTPQHPQCKFSVRIVSILNEVGAKYNSFNILEDEEVRAGLKTYSNWPTYPQLYVNGELIGGIDIVDELKNSGELENVLSTPENPKATSKLDDM